MRWLGLAALATLAWPAGIAQDEAFSQGCTPCECRIAFCDDESTYWPTVSPMTLVRHGNSVAVRWELHLEVRDGNGSDDARFDGDATVLAYGPWSLPVEPDGSPPPTLYERTLTVGNATFPGQQEARIAWEPGLPLFARLFIHGGVVSDESFLSTSEDGRAPAPGLVALGVAVAIVTLSRRRTGCS